MSDTNPTPETEPKRGTDDHLAARIAAANQRAAAQREAAEREAAQLEAAKREAEAKNAAEMAALRVVEAQPADPAAAELKRSEQEAIAHIRAAMQAAVPEHVAEPAHEPEHVAEPAHEPEQVAEPAHGPEHVAEPAREPEHIAEPEPEHGAEPEPQPEPLPEPTPEHVAAIEEIAQTAPPPPPPPAPAPMPAPVIAPPPTKSGGTPVWLTGLIGLLLAGGIYYVWQDRAAPAEPVADPRVAQLEAALKSAQDHIAALENRPAPNGSADANRIAALEAALRALQAKPATTPADTSALEARLATLEKRPPPDIDAIVAGASAGLTAKIAALDAQVQKDEAAATARTKLQAALRAAATALDAGKPIGALPDAPAALSKFATAAPPTEPALRLSFGKFADLAEAASKPSPEGHPFVERMWMQAQGLVTVRQGDHVLVGAPAAVTLEVARGKLEAGDLAGAVASLTPLDPAATRAMKPWRDDAQALVDARAALAAMAAKS